jgi:hypothetical protein
MSGIDREPKRVGHWLSEKKAKKLNIMALSERLKRSGLIGLLGVLSSSDCLLDS